MFTTKDLEELSVIELKRLAIKSKVLETYIDSNDKTPSWDGDIFLYKTDKSKGKCDLKRKISIQLKSTEVDKFSDNEASFSMSVDDLKNYYNNEGTIVFLVEVKDAENFKIFYNSLLPVDLRALLSSLKRENQKSKTIKLKQLKNSAEDIEEVVREFDRNIVKQSKLLVEKQISLENLNRDSKITIDFNELNSLSFDKEYYAYATVGEFNIEVPLVEKFKLTNILKCINGTVAVGDNIHYTSYKVSSQKNKNIIEIGDKIIIDMDKGKIRVENPDTTIDNYLKTLYLMKDIIEHKHVSINKVTIGVNNLFTINEINNRINLLEDIKLVLLKMGVNLDEFSLKSMDDKSFRNLNSLVESILYNRNIKLERVLKEPSIVKMPVGDKNILVMIVPKYKDEYLIVDIFGDELQFTFSNIKEDNTQVDISPYLVLRNDDMNCINFNCDRAKNDIPKYGISKKYMERVNFYILNLLNFYDKNKIENYLDLALYLSGWLSDNYEYDDIYTINKYQAIKRKRKLEDEEIKNLIKIRESNNDEQIKCCINILIENYIEAKFNLDNMDSEIRNEFEKFPIYSLLNVD